MSVILPQPLSPAIHMIVDFNSQYDTDVILLTTAQDGSVTEFHVHQEVLSKASPFFATMFSLPQPRRNITTISHSRNKPIIPVTEPAHILNRTLEYVYRVHPDPLSGLDELTTLLSVASKYDLTLVVESLRASLVSPEFLAADPLHVYAIACRFDLDQEAAVASQWTLNSDFLDDEIDVDQSESHKRPISRDYLRYLPAYDYHRLLVFHRRRVTAVEALFKVPDNVKCMHCNGSMPPKWWQEWVVGTRTELRKRPLETEKVFGVDYVFQAATKAGCVGCVESVLNSWTTLKDMKERIDALPTTI